MAFPHGEWMPNKAIDKEILYYIPRVVNFNHVVTAF
jgi:hypothetical protein